MAGLTFTDAELTRWQYRSANGYARPTNMPDTIALSTARADYFVANPGTDYVSTAIASTDADVFGEFILSAAWEYLLTGNTTYGNAVKSHILNQVSEANTDYSTLGSLGTGSDSITFNAGWVSRLHKAFDYTRDLYSSGEIATVQAWLADAGMFYQRTMNEAIFVGRFKYRSEFARYDTTAALVAAQSGHFIGRKYWVRSTNMYYELIGSKTGNLSDYSTSTTAWRNHWPEPNYASQAAMLADQGNQTAGKLYRYTGLTAGYAYMYNGVANGVTGDYTYGNYCGSDVFNPVSTGLYTHYDSGGTPHNIIYAYMNFYKNPMSMMLHCITLIAFELDDAVMKDHCKLYVEEYLMFATFPDGTVSEYKRNGDYGNPHQGTMFYSLICLEGLLTTAKMFFRSGDNSIYEYSTALGLSGTEGGTKNLRLIIDTLIENCTGTVLRYYASVTSDNLLDTYNANTNTRYLPELTISLAADYYDDLSPAYLLTLSGSRAYGASENHPIGAAGHSYGAAEGFWADVPTMTYETEDLFIVITTSNIRGAQSLLMI